MNIERSNDWTTELSDERTIVRSSGRSLCSIVRSSDCSIADCLAGGPHGGRTAFGVLAAAAQLGDLLRLLAVLTAVLPKWAFGGNQTIAGGMGAFGLVGHRGTSLLHSTPR